MTETRPPATREETIQLRRDSHTLLITINRPAVRNAVDGALAERLGLALADADADGDIRAVVITGAGDRAFCAGGDLKALARGERPISASHPEWGFAGWVGQYVSVPTIAAVNGYALGGGTELVLACDLAIAGKSARFGLPEVKRGIIAGAGGVFRLATQSLQKPAMALLLTGDPVDAPTAQALCLVNEVVPDELVVERAMELAARIARNAPLAVRATKRIARGIRDGRCQAEETAWTQTRDEFERALGTLDAREGLLAFAEKRPPRWRAR